MLRLKRLGRLPEIFYHAGFDTIEQFHGTMMNLTPAFPFKIFAPAPQRRAPYMRCLSELIVSCWNGVTMRLAAKSTYKLGKSLSVRIDSLNS